MRRFLFLLLPLFLLALFFVVLFFLLFRPVPSFPPVQPPSALSHSFQPNATLSPSPFVSTGNLTIFFLNVRHGDSMLAIAPHGNALLIDGGYEDQARTVLGFLQNQSINALDAVIATHPHEDHVGGLDIVLKKMMMVGIVIDNGQREKTRSFQSYDAVARRWQRKRLARDFSFLLDENVNVTVFAPYQQLGYEPTINGNSLVAHLAYGNVSFLLMGDCTVVCEERLAGRLPRATVLKVGHHGDRDATSPLLLQRVQPQVALISTGQQERFGHPHAEVLERLAAARIPVLRTDTKGTIQMVTDGENVWVGK